MLHGVQKLRRLGRPGAALIAASCAMGYHFRETPSETSKRISSTPDDTKPTFQGVARKGSESPDSSYQSSMTGLGKGSSVESFSDSENHKIDSPLTVGPPMRGNIRRSNFVLIAVGTYGDVQVCATMAAFSFSFVSWRRKALHAQGYAETNLDEPSILWQRLDYAEA
jgi:hypothetical protein